MKLQDEIDIITKSFIGKFGNLSAEQLNWKPNAETWSIGQNIDHLIAINKTYFPVIASIRRGDYKLPFHAGFSFVTSFFGKFILTSVEPARKKKMKTFPIWQPQSSAISTNVFEEFSKQQEVLKQLLNGSSDLIESGQVIYSPASKVIVYKLETAFEIIVSHERRHFSQASEILELQHLF